ncbi:hypothetical protein D3C78_536560 [compost metagenome]
MSKQDKELDELLSSRPFHNKKFTSKHKEAVLRDISSGKKKSPSFIERYKLVFSTLVIGAICAGGIFLLPNLLEQQPSTGGTVVQQPPAVEEEQLTLAQNVEGYRVFVFPSEEKDGIYSTMYVESPSGEVVSYPWELRYYEPDFPITMELTDLDQNGAEELLIIVTQERGAGAFLQDIHMLNTKDLSEIAVQDPIDYVNSHSSSTIVNKDDKVNINLEINKKGFRFSYEAKEAGVWNEQLSFGYILNYSMQDNRLQAEIPAVASVGGLSVGSIILEYKLVDGRLTVDSIVFEDTGLIESEQALILYTDAIFKREPSRLAELYGGDYDWLSNFLTDPKAGREDKTKIFESYLEAMPGAIKSKDIVKRTQVSPDEYVYVVTFQYEDGTLFETRAVEMTNSQFTYTVKRINGAFKVMEPPPYQA